MVSCTIVLHCIKVVKIIQNSFRLILELILNFENQSFCFLFKCSFVCWFVKSYLNFRCGNAFLKGSNCTENFFFVSMGINLVSMGITLSCLSVVYIPFGQIPLGINFVLSFCSIHSDYSLWVCSPVELLIRSTYFPDIRMIGWHRLTSRQSGVYDVSF